jgi:hypothetical protein
MKKPVFILYLVTLAILSGCRRPPADADLIGTWTNPDGAELVIRADHQFTARSLPKSVFWGSDQSGLFDGSGQWRLNNGRAYWEVSLRFDRLSQQPANLETEALVSGVGDSVYLYQWRGEEGGERYKLERKRDR